MDNSIFEDISKLYQKEDVDVNEVRHMLARMEEYSFVCPEDEKGECEKHIFIMTIFIEWSEIRTKFHHQKKVLEDSIEYYNSLRDIKIDLYENKKDVLFNLDIFFEGNFVVSISYKLILQDEKKNELRINFYRKVEGKPLSTYQFVLRKELLAKFFDFKVKRLKDEIIYVTPVLFDNWGETISGIFKTINDHLKDIVSICNESCPFNVDGSYKYKQWKNHAKLEITSEDNIYLEQGVKKNEIPRGNHVVGGNGSYVHFERVKYVLKYTVKCVSVEVPISYSHTVDVDGYLRELKEKMGWKNLRYELLNSKLPAEVEVVTYDMDKCYYEREFTPIEYNGSWVQLLREALKDL